MNEFLRTWNVEPRLSSYNPHSNLRAESAVKTAKRIIRGNVCPTTGSLNSDRFARAMLAHRNTPIASLGKSPAMIVFGRHLEEFVPHAMNQNRIHEKWRIDAQERERLMAPSQAVAHERWSAHTRQLLPLQDGDKVYVQNQSKTGRAAKKWDRVGIVIDARKASNDQYLVRMVGSGRTTVRNRAYLRKYWGNEDLHRAPAQVRNDFASERDTTPTSAESQVDTGPAPHTPMNRGGTGRVGGKKFLSPTMTLASKLVS